MRIEQLEYFSSLAKYRSITAASEMLFITPQALSSSIKNLEQELNVALINKNHSGISLTAEGKKLLTTVNDILALCEELYQYQEQPAPAINGNVQFYSTPLICNMLIYSTLSSFYADHPDININIQEYRVADYLNHLEEFDLDLAFIHMPTNYLPSFYKKYEKNYHIIPLLKDKIAFACHREHPLAQKRVISYKTASEYPFVFLHDKDLLYDFNLDEAVEKYGFPKSYSVFSNSFYLINALKSKPQAIGLTLKKASTFLTASQITEDLAIIPMRDGNDISLLAIAPKNTEISEATNATIDYLKKIVRK